MPRDIRNKLQEETTSFTSEPIGLIPAAGRGLRLGLPYPKELYPIIRSNRYKPVAQYVLENMVAAGIRYIILVINETKHQLIGYFGDGSRFGCHISYVVQENLEKENQSTSPGLVHALDAAYHLTQGKTVAFGMPDTIMNPPDVFTNLLENHDPDINLTLGLFQTDRPEKLGMVQFDEQNRVQRIVDKPAQTDLLYAWGCMTWSAVFTEHLHSCLHDGGVTDFALVMNMAIKNGMHVRGVPIQDGSYVDLGTYEDIMELELQHRAL